MNKKIASVLIIGIVLIISGVLLYIVTDQNNKNMIDRENSSRVVEAFNNFKSLAEDFTSRREDLYTNVLSATIILEEIPNKRDEYERYVDLEENTLLKIEESSKDLKELCPNHTYQQRDIVSKCASFITTYETIINYFVKDVEQYNLLIQSFNEMSEDKIKEYQATTEFRNYIDYNGDNNYLGKE